VDLPDRPVAERLADVWAAPLVALVLARSPMVDELSPLPRRAAHATTAQLRIETVEGVAVDLANPQFPEGRPDLAVDVGLVCLPGAVSDDQDL
jgi:hypothetical protein